MKEDTNVTHGSTSASGCVILVLCMPDKQVTSF